MELRDSATPVRRCESGERRDIVAIHAEQKIKPVEIGARHLAGAQPFKVDAVATGYIHGASVRRLALVPVAGARGIDVELRLRPICDDDVAEHAFRQWRTADIAKTDEQDRHFFVLHHVEPDE